MLSPQYVVWLIPLAPFGGIAAMLLLLVAALALAQSWYFHYHDLWAVGPQAWTLLARNLVLVALYALPLVEDEHAVLARRRAASRGSGAAGRARRPTGSGATRSA